MLFVLAALRCIQVLKHRHVHIRSQCGQPPVRLLADQRHDVGREPQRVSQHPPYVLRVGPRLVLIDRTPVRTARVEAVGVERGGVGEIVQNGMLLSGVLCGLGRWGAACAAFLMRRPPTTRVPNITSGSV